MEMERIIDFCKDHKCGKCPLYDQDYWECVVRTIPLEWDIEDIERRLENYGKEKSTDSRREI